jgi:hypothetical protein
VTTLFATRRPLVSAPFDLPASAPGLRADRTDITFSNLSADLVRIDVRVTNEDRLPSPPTEVQVQSAPLGAFLTWRPLFTLAVPLLLPRQSVVVSGVAWTLRPNPLGAARSVTPARLQEALLATPEAEAPAEPDSPRRSARLRRLRRPPSPVLANDPLALLGRDGVHWAGNIDVLLHRKPVERHLAQALRVYPGQTNAALFHVGDRTDGYRFSLTGMADEWQAGLVGLEHGVSLRPGCGWEVGLDEWLELRAHSLFFLLLRPPVDAERGEVQVHVERQSDGAEAVVEFSLDARAAGAGCYTV